jgi:UDP-N-acetylglucosamine acyltransferase
MSSKIHKTAIVESGARIGDDVDIGPYCIVGPKVELKERVRLVAHVVLDGRTTIGAGTIVYPFASLGQPPQAFAYHGEDTTLVIGENNLIREYVTMNPGTADGRGITSVGSNCMFMANSHVAHDCDLGDNIVFANCATVGGHVEIGDYAWFGGMAGAHQFTRIGKHAFVGGLAGLRGDLIPFGSVIGNHAHLAGLNLVGLKRRGFSREVIHDLRNAYRLLFAEEGTFQERLDDVAELFAKSSEVMAIVDFIRSGGQRPLCMPNRDD